MVHHYYNNVSDLLAIPYHQSFRPYLEDNISNVHACVRRITRDWLNIRLVKRETVHNFHRNICSN